MHTNIYKLKVKTKKLFSLLDTISAHVFIFVHIHSAVIKVHNTSKTYKHKKSIQKKIF